MPIIYDYTGHMVSTESEEELHCFAKRIGLSRSWYQAYDKHPHYDLTTTRIKRSAALAGAVLTTSQVLVELAWWSKK